MTALEKEKKALKERVEKLRLVAKNGGGGEYNIGILKMNSYRAGGSPLNCLGLHDRNCVIYR